MSRSRQVALTAVGMLAVGFLIGRWTAPGPPPGARPAPSARIEATRESVANEKGFGRLGVSSDDPAALLEDPETAAKVREMAERAVSWGADPRDLVVEMMDQVDDDALVSLVTTLTDYDRAELEDVEDMRAFVQRLAEVAIDGSIVPASPPDPNAGVVEFATDVYDDNSALDAANHFGGESDRIYAVFDTSQTTDDEVFAKWTRVEDGEILLFKRHAINARDDYSYVWLGRPEDGWTPGEYRVDFYTADESLVPVATGLHVVSR